MEQELKFIFSLNEINKIVNQIFKFDWQFLLLSGELGVGKTTLVKEIAKKLNIKETVNSPTFNLMKVYDNLIHIDAYKLSGDLEEFEDFFDDKKVIIEWAENIILNTEAKIIKLEILFTDNLDKRIYKIKKVN
ncbi:tRNA (adenosine(37)-N6)-threonylcarbamoyltransferase complex ATPase subunit type 1 TsaE [Mesomycoplasma neurolyticum]|uniref:tRNA threonylcarbamoyladenosine biosynthesis protein TsaE n=1 Tax=Mesomycoplasma neurolyticum TaxID=2120 RepID=A0A449A4D5_9BACT|nr:tRNA (adenosine(37)-N6)-threonylcarbamoyltransferase complex ATPase subunit type 1 TsaE [Mesomycoplasma neurolyticum]VEU59082.1 ATPase or kinase [Mesomycoplasma neurolyticum]